MVDIVFLLGAGTSIPAGFLKTAEITNLVLTGSGVRRDSEETYRLGGGNADKYVRLVSAFLRRISAEIEAYYAALPNHETNYEELYYVARQVADSETREYNNPIVKPFADKIRADSERFIMMYEAPHSLELSGLAEETCNYIHDIVWRTLSRAPTQLTHLQVFGEAISNEQVRGVKVFTLNHDTLLEKYFNQHGITFFDGFTPPINEVRYWDPENAQNQDSRVQLFKLHGSVDWFRLGPQSGGWENEAIGISLEGDVWHTISPEGESQLPLDGRPVLLVGTFNKILKYSSGIFAYLHNEFRVALKKASLLVICGYSFGDKGINSYICNWVYSLESPRIVIIHQRHDRLKAMARGAIANKWNDWREKGILRIVPKWIEEVSWQNIRDAVETDIS